MISPHPHTLVAIIIIRIVVRVGVRHAYPKKGEVPEVVTMVEASTRDSAEACSAGHGSKPSCTKSAAKSAARGQTSVEASPTAAEGSPAAVETAAATAVETAAAAVSAATTATTRGSIHWHRGDADCRNCRKSDQHFPEHGTLLSQVSAAPNNRKPHSPQIIPHARQIHSREVGDCRELFSRRAVSNSATRRTHAAAMMASQLQGFTVLIAASASPRVWKIVSLASVMFGVSVCGIRLTTVHVFVNEFRTM